MVTSAQCVAKYGQPLPENEYVYMVLWDIPDDINKALPALPNKLYCNKEMPALLEKGFRNLITRGLASELKCFDGCFNVRQKRGLTSMSLHSWGAAIDVNAAWNQLGKTPTLSPAFVKCFTDVGFEWGGTWTRKDGMHFQLAKI